MALFKDPEAAWNILLQLIAQAQWEELDYVGAGLLEDICEDHADQFIDRIEYLAASDPKFQEALACVWVNSHYQSPAIVQRLVVASGHRITPFDLTYERAEQDELAKEQDGA